MDRKWVLLVAGILAVLASGVAAEPVTKLVERTVLLPDGQPAAGLKVIIRTFGPNGIGVTDYEALTDEKGRFAREVPVEVVKFDPMNLWRDGYVIVAAPGCALTLAVLDPKPGTDSFNGSEQALKLKLPPAFEVTGQVLGPDKTPVVGATVAITRVSEGGADPPWYLNAPEKQVATPLTTVTSGADGRFVLPGLWTEKSRGMINAACLASAPGLKTPSEAIYNSDPRFVRPFTLYLAPTLTVRAKVLDPAGQPVAGATVMPYGDPWNAIKQAGPRTTDADGQCLWENVARLEELHLQATHPDFAMGEAPARLQGTEVAVEVRLRALALLSGRITEEGAAGQPPAVLPTFVSALYQAPRSTQRQMNSIPGGFVRGAVQPDGSFALRTAAGSNRVRVENSLYEEPRYFSLEVPPEGLRDAVIPVNKRMVFFVQFIAADPAMLEGISLRYRKTPESPPTSPASNITTGRWVWTTKAWGDQVEIEVTRKGQVVLPWTTVTADPANWPQVVKIP